MRRLTGLLRTNDPLSETKIPHTDLHSLLRKFIKNSWPLMWDQCEHNKLQGIHPTLDEWKGGCRINRTEEVVLARARIGHTHMTHSFLLKNEDIHECFNCCCFFTAKHFLVECDDCSHIRWWFYNVRDIKELFDTVNPTTILDFIHASGLFHRF